MKKLISAMLALLMLASAAMANPGPPPRRGGPGPGRGPAVRPAAPCVQRRDREYSARRGRALRQGPECSVHRAICRRRPEYTVRPDRAREARRPA